MVTCVASRFWWPRTRPARSGRRNRRDGRPLAPQSRKRHTGAPVASGVGWAGRKTPRRPRPYYGPRERAAATGVTVGRLLLSHASGIPARRLRPGVGGWGKKLLVGFDHTHEGRGDAVPGYADGNAFLADMRSSRDNAGKARSGILGIRRGRRRSRPRGGDGQWFQYRYAWGRSLAVRSAMGKPGVHGTFSFTSKTQCDTRYAWGRSLAVRSAM